MPQQGELLMSKDWLDAGLSVVTNASVPHHMPGYGVYQQVSPLNTCP